MIKKRKEAIRLIEDYFIWKKISKIEAMDIFDLIHLSHKGNSWKNWIWNELAEENNISEDLFIHAEMLELTIRIFDIQIEEIRGYSRMKKRP